MLNFGLWANNYTEHEEDVNSFEAAYRYFWGMSGTLFAVSSVQAANKLQTFKQLNMWV